MRRSGPPARPSFLPFRALGLEGNPFRTLTEEEWETFALLPPAVERLLAGTADPLQILGPRGRGKTSLLYALRRWLGGEGLRWAYEYLPQGVRRYRTPLSGLDVFLLDEAQRLSGRWRRRLVRTALREGVRLILTSHEDLTPTFRAFGLTLRTLPLPPPTVEEVARLLNARLAFFARGGPPPWRLTEDAAAFLLGRYGENVRGMEAFLYLYFQTLPPPGPVDGAALRTFYDRSPSAGGATSGATSSS